MIFIDGTKIEAAINKYTFVWKKTVTKNMEKLLQKMSDLVASCEEKYGIRVVLESMEPYLHFKYQNIVADAGYESKENYLFLEKNGQTAP